jgi:hypothetical protein
MDQTPPPPSIPRVAPADNRYTTTALPTQDHVTRRDYAYHSGWIDKETTATFKRKLFDQFFFNIFVFHNCKDRRKMLGF